MTDLEIMTALNNGKKISVKMNDAKLIFQLDPFNNICCYPELFGAVTLFNNNETAEEYKKPLTWIEACKELDKGNKILHDKYLIKTDHFKNFILESLKDGASCNFFSINFDGEFFLQ